MPSPYSLCKMLFLYFTQLHVLVLHFFRALLNGVPLKKPHALFQYVAQGLGQRIEKEHEVSSMERRLAMLEKNEEPKHEVV